MRLFKRGCRWVRRQRWRYLDHTLSESDRAEIDRHLGVCVPCRAVYAEAQHILEMLKQGQPLPPPLQRQIRRPARQTVLKAGITLIAMVLLMGASYMALNLPVERWLSQRGVATLSQPTPSPVNSPSVAVVEAVPETPLRSTAPPIATEGATPKLAPLKPTLSQPATAPQTPSAKRNPRPLRKRPPTPRSNTPVKPAPPPEGTVEIYDAGGNLIQRHQIKEDTP